MDSTPDITNSSDKALLRGRALDVGARYCAKVQRTNHLVRRAGRRDELNSVEANDTAVTLADHQSQSVRILWSPTSVQALGS